MQKICVCIVGKSCTGKSTLAKYCKEKYELKMLESYTTRPKREKELEGHTFITDKEFDELNNIVAYGEFGGYRYCATKEQIDNSDLYVVDLQGIKELKEKYIDNENKRRIYVVYIHTSFVKRLIRSIKDNGLINGIKRIQRDKGMFTDINKTLSNLSWICLSHNNTCDTREISKFIQDIVEDNIN